MRNSNTTTTPVNATAEWGFKLQLSEQQIIDSPLDDIQISTTCPFEKRTYFVYFNTTSTSTPTALYDNNHYGNLGTLNDTSDQIGIPFVKVYPAQYKNYQENITNVADAPWWNNQWSFRLMVNVSSPAFDYYYSNHLIELRMDFTQILDQIGANNYFDENSIRILEYDEYFEVWRDPTPYQFDKDVDFIPNVKASGLLSWVVDGKTTFSRTRFYFIYFDNIEFGVKAPVDYSSVSSLSYTLNGANDYTVENSKIQFSVKEGLPPNGFYEDHIYNLYDKRNDKTIINPDTRQGWALSAWNFGGVTQTSPYFIGVTDRKSVV